MLLNLHKDKYMDGMLQKNKRKAACRRIEKENRNINRSAAANTQTYQKRLQNFEYVCGAVYLAEAYGFFSLSCAVRLSIGCGALPRSIIIFLCVFFFSGRVRMCLRAI